MRPAVVATLYLLLPLAAGARSAVDAQDWQVNAEAFHADLVGLTRTLAVPGVAYAIVDGKRIVALRSHGQQRDGRAFTIDTPLRIASVTKHLSAVVIARLVAAGRIDLDRPIEAYLPEFGGDRAVTVRHLLTHTSEGHPGAEYVYGTSRFALLGRIVTEVTGSPFEQALRESVLDPAGMPPRASPHLGAHAGLVATAADMARYLIALEGGDLLDPEWTARWSAPSLDLHGRPLPLGLGWFVQDVQGQRLIWAFGQDDPEHSGALLLWHRASGLGLFLLANANVISDAYRLLMGDVSVSPVALAFIARFVDAEPGRPQRVQDCDRGDADWPPARIDGCRSQVLTALWTGQEEAAVTGVRTLAKQGKLFAGSDPVLHFAALRLPDPELKLAFFEMGHRLLAGHPDNRWLLLAQGYLAQQLDRHEAARAAFQHILDLPNQHPDHLALLFRVWSWSALAESSIALGNPDQARVNLRHIIDSGIGGEMAEFARSKLEELASP